MSRAIASKGIRALFSPPPCGEGSGVGVEKRGTSVLSPSAPPPRPSPARGEGAEAARCRGAGSRGLARGCLILSAAAFAWASCAHAQDAGVAAKGDAAHGKQLYLTIGCSYCHGTVGQGGGGRTGGLRLAQMPIPFAAFLNQLRHPANEMPPYVDSVVSDHDAGDIFAYVTSLPPPPDMKTIPILTDLGP